MAEEETEDDVTQFLHLLESVPVHGEQVSSLVKKMSERVESGELCTAKGISFLECKNHLLLSYLINLTCVTMKKFSGEKIEGDESIDRLIENRTVLEKIRSVDHKLKYQIDKLVKTATTGTASYNDPLRFKPNPDALVSKPDEGTDDDEESEDDGNGVMKRTKEEHQKKYIPPKLAAMHYEGDETEKQRIERLTERAKKRALSSSVMQELRREYFDGPEEIFESTVTKMKEDKEKRHQQTYEEEYLVRLQMPKKRGRERQNMAVMSNLDQLTHFGDFKALSGEVDAEMLVAKKKQKKANKMGKKGKRGKTNRFKRK